MWTLWNPLVSSPKGERAGEKGMGARKKKKAQEEPYRKKKPIEGENGKNHFRGQLLFYSHNFSDHGIISSSLCRWCSPG
jgi:hypothetical protein